MSEHAAVDNAVMKASMLLDEKESQAKRSAIKNALNALEEAQKFPNRAASKGGDAVAYLEHLPSHLFDEDIKELREYCVKVREID